MIHNNRQIPPYLPLDEHGGYKKVQIIADHTLPQMLQRLFDGGWAHRAQDSRVVHFTPKGELALRQWLATHPDAPNSSAAQGPAPC